MTSSSNDFPHIYVPSVDDNLISEGTEKDEFIPIDPEYLSVERACGFPIYVFHPGRKRFVLFKSAGNPIRHDQYEKLTKGGKRTVFVPQTFAHELNEYLSESLTEIVTNPDFPLKQKTEKFHSLAATVLKGILDSPEEMKELVTTAKNVSNALTKLIISEPKAIVQLNQLRSYDYNTYHHCINVSVLSIGLFKELQENVSAEEIMDLTRGILLHDIGKCDIPSEIINKPGPLNDSEWDIMRDHTIRGNERLQVDEDMSEDARLVSLYHHEASDGSGYPYGLTNEQIPFTSRICKVVDIYDALTSRRSYKDGMPPFEALRLMTNEMINKVDQGILKHFMLYLHRLGKLSKGG